MEGHEPDLLVENDGLPVTVIGDGAQPQKESQ